MQPCASGTHRSAFVVALFGLLGLAAAMGIGRFAFTPLLPLMQQHDGLTLAQGAWLASANYLGYLAGAMASYVWLPSARRAILAGLLVVALTTAAMAFEHGETGRLALRFAAGAASAFVLVGVAGWSLDALGTMGRSALAGWVFAGVGCGVAAAGLVGLVTGHAGASPDLAWLVLGAAALAVAIAGWAVWGEERTAASMPPLASASASSPGSGAGGPAGGHALGAPEWALVIAYGGFGFGYILPATFLPAMTRSLAADPLVFGWAWPVFGGAAAASTVIVTRWFAGVPPRTIFIAGLLVMTLGVLVPVLHPTLATIVVAALCVGGTFMVLTMAGFQEARRLAQGVPGAAAALIAAMTAAFALGQLLGPLLVGLWQAARHAGAAAAFAAGAHDLAAPSWMAAAALLLSVIVLAFGPAAKAPRALAAKAPAREVTTPHPGRSPP